MVADLLPAFPSASNASAASLSDIVVEARGVSVVGGCWGTNVWVWVDETGVFDAAGTRLRLLMTVFLRELGRCVPCNL